MPTKSSVNIGQRDAAILAAVASCPLTVDQLLELSTTFACPFPNREKLSRRLRRLKRAGYLNSWPYSIVSGGRSPDYFKVTRKGYREINGADAKLPKPRYFSSIAEGSHKHTNDIARFLVHLKTLVHRRGWEVRKETPENSICIVDNGKVLLRPDSTFEICTPTRTIPFRLELDRGTEQISNDGKESIERKVKTYDRDAAKYAIADPSRYFVLFVTTRTPTRRDHIVQAAASAMTNPNRSLFLTATLSDFLNSTDLLNDRVFVDTTGRNRSMVRHVQRRQKSATSSVTKPLSSANVESLSVNHLTSASVRDSSNRSLSSHTTASRG